jgi:hypothetical protein
MIKNLLKNLSIGLKTLAIISIANSSFAQSKPSLYIFNDAMTYFFQQGGYGTHNGQSFVNMITPATTIKGRTVPVKIDNRAQYFEHITYNYSGWANIMYHPNPPALANYPGGVSFWFYGVRAAPGLSDIQVQIRAVGYAGPPNYGWDKQTDAVTMSFPVGRWHRVVLKPEQIGGLNANFAGLIIAPAVSTSNPGTMDYALSPPGTAFVIDDVKLLAERCDSPRNSISGFVENRDLNGKVTLSADRGMFVTAIKNNEIVDVVPVTNGRFDFGRQFCDGFYEFTLGTRSGGSNQGQALAGRTFISTTVNGTMYPNRGKSFIDFNGNTVNGVVKFVMQSNQRLKKDIEDVTADQNSQVDPAGELNLDVVSADSKSVLVNTNAEASAIKVYNKMGQLVDFSVNKVSKNTYSIASNNIPNVVIVSVKDAKTKVSKKVIIK